MKYVALIAIALLGCSETADTETDETNPEPEEWEPILIPLPTESESVEVRVSTVIEPGEVGDAIAACPESTSLVEGGCDVTGFAATGPATMDVSPAHDAGPGLYSCLAKNVGLVPGTLTAWARCE